MSTPAKLWTRGQLPYNPLPGTHPTPCPRHTPNPLPPHTPNPLPRTQEFDAKSRRRT